MTTLEEVRSKVNDFLDGDYEVEDISSVPSVDQVALGKKAKKLQVCAFSIDIRDSTGLLTAHQKQTAGKIHKSFLYATAATVVHYGGSIRSFKGDGLLALWPAKTKGNISTAVRAALTTKWLLDIDLKPQFSKFRALDFGIGLDWGEVYIVRAGIARDANNNDLVFIGSPINFAVAISEQAKAPYHIEVSERTVPNLVDAVRYIPRGDGREDLWKDGTIEWQGAKHKTAITTAWLPAFGDVIP